MFYTIQGEGPDAGKPAVFVRLAKCNLRCHFCDTEFETGTPRSVADVSLFVQRATKDNNCRLVVITGGEPMLQNLVPLIRILNRNGIAVSVETAGTVFSLDHEHAFMQRENKLVVSPKTPQVLVAVQRVCDAYKYIVRAGDVAEDDGLPNMSTQIPGNVSKLFRPKDKRAQIYVQPMDEQDETRNRANAELAAQVCMRFGYRLSLQMHKLVGVP